MTIRFAIETIKGFEWYTWNSETKEVCHNGHPLGFAKGLYSAQQLVTK